jgi:hypothetical protein
MVGYGLKNSNFEKKQKPENLSDKLEKLSDKPIKPVGLSFFI